MCIVTLKMHVSLLYSYLLISFILPSDYNSKNNVWLFDIENDPNETEDLSYSNPKIVRFLLDRLAYYNSTAVPVRFPDLDPDADPAKHGGVWGPWME